jgi:hypothetical protein
MERALSDLILVVLVVAAAAIIVLLIRLLRSAGAPRATVAAHSGEQV